MTRKSVKVLPYDPHWSSLTPFRSVTVRQTLDPYVKDVQYIASYETTLTPSGDLDLSTIGIGRERIFMMMVRRVFHQALLFKSFAVIFRQERDKYHL